VTTVAAAIAYRDRIIGALTSGRVFTPLMTAYLTDGIQASDIKRGFHEGALIGNE
jgi:dihydroorotase